MVQSQGSGDRPDNSALRELFPQRCGGNMMWEGKRETLLLWVRAGWGGVPILLRPGVEFFIYFST